jgi:phospholipase C
MPPRLVRRGPNASDQGRVSALPVANQIWVVLMQDVDRRRFLQLAGGSVGALMLSDSIARAATIPANRRTRSLEDVEHIVVLMQENRSFDHYFGVLRGVRGFGDPHPLVLPSGQPVWDQADGSTVVPPFRPDVPGNLALTFIEDLDHSWDGTHQMFNGGNWDQWLPAKTATCMAHMDREDLPFHYALADAFTVCDGYHCAMLGPTDPNRYYMWSGWDGNDGQGGGPVIANDELGYGWQTYPERLQAAGVSWKIYQDVGEGLDAAHFWGWTSDDPYIGNYGDNSLLYFFNYQNAVPGSPLYLGARTGTNVSAGGGFFDVLTADVQSGNLPQVSWVVAPESYTEHPNWPGGYGAWYTAGVLNALTSDPDVWAKTALLITFDENDGFFDHVVAPYPNVGALNGDSTVALDNELFNGQAGTPKGSGGVVGPYGGGVRVPLLCVSPWSTGGYVCSETFDHTSLIRFIEARYGVSEPNITPWRRAVFGDLTSAFDFESASDTVPPLPSVAAYKPQQLIRHPDYIPQPPAVGAVPAQEPGVRPSRQLGYQLAIDFAAAASTLDLSIRNPGTLGVSLQARSLTVSGAPYSYTVGAGDNLTVQVPNPGTYDLSLHGPNGFFRHFAGSPQTVITVQETTHDRAGRVKLRITANVPSSGRRRHRHPVIVNVADAYGGTYTVEGNGEAEIVVQTRNAGGWYDLALTSPADASFSYQLAGRLESRGPLTSDPQLGRS